VRIRTRFAKLGRVRWTSHRDVARMWERALRRCSVPVAYTAGFSPRPKLSFGLALPTGCESVAEYLDIALAEPVDPRRLCDRVGPMLPAGVEVMAAYVVERSAPSLQQDVSSCTWEIAVPHAAPADLEEVIARTLRAERLEIRRERKGRVVVDDVRPSLRSLSCSSAEGEGVVLRAELGTRPRGVRPTDLARAMGVEFGVARRTNQWIERDGSRWEPITAPVIPDAVTGARAS
jgi:radical SAM-linked protein